MRRLLVIGSALALVASVLWLVGGRDARRDSLPATRVATSSQPTPLELVPAATVSTSARPATRVAAPATSIPTRDSERARAARPAGSDAAPTLAGIVIAPGGAPVAGADVEIEADVPFRSALGALASTRTGSDGRFELQTRYTGPFRVIATARDAGRITGQGTLDAVEPGRTDLVIVLPSTFVRGVVVDDTGAPVTDYRISWRPLRDGQPSAGSGKSVRIRASTGEFTADLSPGEWRCSVSPKGDLVNAELDLIVPALEAPTIVLARKALLRGSVFDPSGGPVARAALTAPGHGSTASREGGEFLLELAPGSGIHVWAEHPDFAGSAALELTLAPGEERDGIVFQLGERARLSGEVIGPDGRPVPDREVTIARPMMGGVWSRYNEGPGTTTTDASGRFSVDVQPGRLHVQVELTDEELDALGRTHSGSGDRPRAVRTVMLGPGEHGHVRLVMGGEPVRVRGRIEVDGEAPDEVSVRLLSLGSGIWARGTYAYGEYELIAPFPGAYQLMVNAMGVGVQPFLDVPEVGALRHDVSIPLGRITGRVRDERGTTLEGITVDASSDGDGHAFRSSSRAETDRHGTYALTVLPGRYRISPREDFEEERSFLASEPAFVDVQADGTLTGVDFVLNRTGAITGTVLTTTGARLERASVRMEVAGPGVHDDWTDAHDRFHVPLDAGTYWLTATGDDGQTSYFLPEPVRVELARGETREVQLLLAPSTIVIVRLIEVVDPVWLQLEALDARGRSHPAVLPEESMRRLELPSPGSYVLRGRHGGVAFERPLELDAWVPQVEIELRLDR